MLSAPVVLVIDTDGMTRGISPLIRGYLGFDPAIDIRGVILNKVGGARHESKLRAALERYTGTEVLGAIGCDEALEIPERHLGLIPANEVNGAGNSTGTAQAMITRLAEAVSFGIDLDRIIEIAGGHARIRRMWWSDIPGAQHPVARGDAKHGRGCACRRHCR